MCLKYGLSYTTFGYSNLSVKSSGNRTYQVSFNVKNTGSREGTDVPQIYVGDSHSKVPRPLKELKGFSKVSLRPGETKTVSIILDERSFSYFDVNANRWRVEPGDFDVLVGHSSGQIELQGKLSF